MRLANLATPAVLIDSDRVDANLVRAQGYADRHGLRLWSPIGTEKSPCLARRQVELGAIGVTCQTIGEAEGAAKLRRLWTLAARVALTVTADSRVTVQGARMTRMKGSAGLGP